MWTQFCRVRLRVLGAHRPVRLSATQIIGGAASSVREAGRALRIGNLMGVGRPKLLCTGFRLLVRSVPNEEDWL